MAENATKEYKISDNLSVLVFEDAAQPAFVEKKGKPYIFYGEKNDYPQYLLYLYNNSSKHSALINGKVDYIMGKGWVYDKKLPDADVLKLFIAKANVEDETLKEVSSKCCLDLEIFGGAYIQVEWAKKGGVVADIYHVDYSTVRSDKENTQFFVCEDWVIYKPDGSYRLNTKPQYDTYPAYDPKSPKGTQILYIKKYHPGIKTYTLPAYRGSNTWIEIDIEIANYHLNNTKTGFFANKMINFNDGNIGEEEKSVVEAMVKRKFAGSKGQKFMLNFNRNADTAATVEDLGVNDSDKIFDLLNTTAQQEILTGHRVVSPMLFGIKTEGQLGGTGELRTAYEIFQNTYVNGKQQLLEDVFNSIAKKKGVTSDAPLKIQPTEPVSFQFSENTLAQVMTPDEIREKAGLAPRNAGGAAPSQFTSKEDESDADVFAMFGRDRQDYEIAKTTDVMFMSDEDERAHFAATVDALTALQSQILAILKKDPLTTQQALADALGESLDMVNSAIHDLVYNEVLKVDQVKKSGETVVRRQPIRDADKILEQMAPETRSVQVLYSYEGPKDDRNRPFCKKLLELNRLYSRADIEKISTRLQYSVWARRGGWYTIPGTNTHQPFCRHNWKSNIVVKRAS